MRKLLLSIAAASLCISAGSVMACEMADDASASNAAPFDMAKVQPAAVASENANSSVRPKQVKMTTDTKADAPKAVKVVKAKPLVLASDSKTSN